MAKAVKQRGTILPIAEYDDGTFGMAWPEMVHAPAMAFKRAVDSGMPSSVSDPAAAEAAYRDMGEVALGTMLGGSVASMGSGAARGAVGSAGGKLRLGPVDRTPFGGGQADIFDGDRLLGRVSYAVDGSVAQIDDIAVADGSNSLGVSGIKALREAFREIEPNVTRFEGGRAPGMKTGAARQGAIWAAYPKRLQQLDIAANAKSGAAVPLALDAAERSTPQGIRAYHGSPHDFDRFSLDKIGTGEGAQAYGHGLYFADSEDVARSYRDQLSGDIGLQFPDEAAALEAAGPGGSALKNVHGWAARTADGEWKSYNIPGRMYEVNIKADPEDFLDWDKPLSQQSEAVRSVAQSVIDEFGLTKRAASDLYANQPLGNLLSGPDYSAALRQQGIPGIRYLDSVSRDGGAGSSNYVVFDENLIDILRKYQNPPTGAALPLAADGSEQQDPQTTMLANLIKRLMGGQ